MTFREAAEVIHNVPYTGKDQEEALEIAENALKNLNLVRANAYIIEKLINEVTEDE